MTGITDAARVWPMPDSQLCAEVIPMVCDKHWPLIEPLCIGSLCTVSRTLRWTLNALLAGIELIPAASAAADNPPPSVAQYTVAARWLNLGIIPGG